MISNLLIGLIIGIGLILPGVSGGVIAVVLNVYDRLIYSMNKLLKDPKTSLKFLIPIGIGIIIGVSLLGKLLNYLLFEKNYIETYFVFIGLILGSVPKLINQTKKKGNPNYILMLTTFVLSLTLFILGKDSVISLSVNNNTFIGLFLTGFIFSTGKIVPGISSSFLLILIGTYEYFLKIIVDPIGTLLNNITDIIPLALGVVTGLIIFVKLMNYLLNKHYGNTYSIIIGFVLGSIIAIYPGLTFDIHGLLSVLLCGISFVISYKFSKIKN